jgi:hypothetical protein
MVENSKLAGILELLAAFETDFIFSMALFNVGW